MESLACMLRRLRRAQGLTLAALADRVGVTPGYLSMIENRRVDNPPSVKVLDRLERELNVGDGALLRTAQWERTPQPIREELERARERFDEAGGTGKPSGSPGTVAALRRSVAELQARPSPAFTDAAGPAPVRVPLINKVAAGYPSGFTDLDYPARVADDVVVVPGYTGLHGGNDPDAFAATVCGDSMLPAYQAGDVVVFSPLADVVDGCDCFVRLEPDHETTFKRVYLNEEDDTIRLEPLNRDYPTRTVDREQVAGLFRAVWRMSRL